MEAEREAFVHGDTERGMPRLRGKRHPEKVANEIYDEIQLCVLRLQQEPRRLLRLCGFRTAYIKCHYPQRIYGGAADQRARQHRKVIEYSGECARLGIRVLPPDINVSGGGFTADDSGRIRFGLNAVKNVGRNLIERS